MGRNFLQKKKVLTIKNKEAIMATKENNVVENTTKVFENKYEECSYNNFNCKFDAVLDELRNKLDKLFLESEVHNKVYHQRLTCIFSVLYVFMDTTPKGWEINIQKCKNFSVEMMYEVSELLAKTLENSINQEKLVMQDIAIYVEINSMLDVLNSFIARCGSTAALTNDEGFRILHAETIGKLVNNLDKHIAI